MAIVGRPNVGKSSLFNVFAGRRIAIVEPTSGVTRDRVCARVEHKGKAFEAIDTGGIGMVDSQHLEEEVEKQVLRAIDESQLILFLVDAREGLTPLDKRVARILIPKKEGVILVANKVESAEAMQTAGEFFALGYGEPRTISALERIGTRTLLEEIMDRLPQAPPPSSPVMKIALVGKRNAGKSTLINTLAGEARVIVSEIPGTTRDSVDILFHWKDKIFLAIDTAGVRKRKQVEGSVDFYSQKRTERSIRRADVVFLMLDATTEISQVDKKIADYIEKNFKPCIILFNKWDLVEGIPRKEFREYLRSRLPGHTFAPLVFISAKTGKGVEEALPKAENLFSQAQTRVSTKELNRILGRAYERRKPAPKRGKLPKIYYGTQTAVQPPTMVLFVNEPSLFKKSYERFLANFLREGFPFGEIPIRIIFRKSAGRESEGKRFGGSLL